MEIKDFEKYRLPKIYKRNGRECYLDPIRKKLIYITPEETVRQRVISYLIDELKVPQEMVLVEEHLSHYGLDTKRRADIIIHAVDDENLENPIAVIECKAPEVYLDEKALNQMLDYSNMLCVTYTMVINGNVSFCYKYDETSNQYIPIESFPNYGDMIVGKYHELVPEEYPDRLHFDELQSYLEETFESMDKDDYGSDIYKCTPMKIAVPVFNLLEGLLNPYIKMPAGDYGLFELIEDYGVRLRSYGNASGGSYFGPYRSFLVKIGDNTEFYSIGTASSFETGHPERGRTVINVAHDDEKESHHALQLSADDNLEIVGDKVQFYHHGRISIGRMGSGKVAELRQFVEDRCPELIKGNRFYLGTITNDRNWSLDDPEVINVIANLIKYAMIRDEYRDYVKNNRGK